jgi:phage shock protein C
MAERLYPSKKEWILGGVCGGIGKYSDVDPNVIRLILIVLTLLSIGVGVIAYIIAWLLLPEEENGTGTVTATVIPPAGGSQ